TWDNDRYGGGPVSTLSGGILATDDGGRHWRRLALPEGFYASGGVSFLGPERSFITGYSRGAEGSQVLTTTDGGQTWRVLYADAALRLDAVHFLNPQQGFVAGNRWALPSGGAKSHSVAETILATNDGGASWQSLYRRETPLGGAAITRLRFSSPAIGW